VPTEKTHYKKPSNHGHLKPILNKQIQYRVTLSRLLMYFGIQGHDKSWPFYLSLSRANDKNLLIKNSRPVFGCGK
ncbi:hypothetical protein, partial [Klebsiella pneumoniae]|uniref:hypothetical protein n=2 Tax=Klebsiella pneumoniae TaxID=573 RepID=UPI0023588226